MVKQVPSFFKLVLYARYCGIALALWMLCCTEGKAQLLEDGQGKLKTIKTESRGFLFFFGRKIKSEDPRSFQRGKKEKIRVRSAPPANYDPNPRQIAPRTSFPVSYNRKEVKTRIRTSKPVSYNRKEQQTAIRTSSPVSYNRKERAANPRYSLPPLPERHKKIEIRYSRVQKQRFYDDFITTQLKLKRRPGPMEKKALFGKNKFLSQRPWVYRNKLSITGNATFKFDERLRQQFRPINYYTETYRGDHKRTIPFLKNIRYRFGQWERSSYRGHHIYWSKFGKKVYLKGNSDLVFEYRGHLRMPMPLIDNIRKKMVTWEQTHYQGRSTGWSKLGNKAFLRGSSTLATSYQGEMKVKRRKGGDMHPSIAYISGKKFSNNNWKERWRKLNILWVRLNPGKEVPDGPREKVKVKYDKEERDLWTY